MIRRTAFALAVLSSVLAGAAAPAPKGPVAASKGTGGANESDLKCMLIASVLSQNTDPKARSMSGLMAFYYLGRIDAKTPGIDLRGALQTEAQAVKQTEMQAEGRRCVNSLNSRAQALQSLSGPTGGARPPAAAAPAPASGLTPFPAPAAAPPPVMPGATPAPR